jgi:hypothetical protein
VIVSGHSTSACGAAPRSLCSRAPPGPAGGEHARRALARAHAQHGARRRRRRRDPTGRQRSKTFRTKKEANGFLADAESSKSRGAFVSPHAGRVLFSEHAAQWMATWNTEITTAARDSSIMRTHVLPQWGAVQLGKIDHIDLQAWVTELGHRRSRATVVEALRLTSGVLRSAVRNRLIPFNPADDVRAPRTRTRDTDERIISRADLRQRLLPAVPPRYRASWRLRRAPVCGGVRPPVYGSTRSISTPDGSR